MLVQLATLLFAAGIVRPAECEKLDGFLFPFCGRDLSAIAVFGGEVRLGTASIRGAAPRTRISFPRSVEYTDTAPHRDHLIAKLYLRESIYLRRSTHRQLVDSLLQSAPYRDTGTSRLYDVQYNYRLYVYLYYLFAGTSYLTLYTRTTNIERSSRSNLRV